MRREVPQEGFDAGSPAWGAWASRILWGVLHLLLPVNLGYLGPKRVEKAFLHEENHYLLDSWYVREPRIRWLFSYVLLFVVQLYSLVVLSVVLNITCSFYVPVLVSGVPGYASVTFLINTVVYSLAAAVSPVQQQFTAVYRCTGTW